MMVKNKLNRIKAAVVSAAMVATTLAAPVMSSFTAVTAASKTKEVSTLPHTFIADGIQDGDCQANVALPGNVKAGDTIYLNFTTSETTNATIGIYGFGTDSEADGWWIDDEQQFSSGGKTTFECAVVIPSAMEGNPTKVGVSVYYPKDSSEWTLNSIKTSGGTSSDDPATPDIPVSENDKSGTCNLVDNGDGTATITATLSAQYADPEILDEKGNPSTQFDILLTQGVDEEQYAPYLDKDGNEFPPMEEGDPINSHKFLFKNFNIDDMANIKFQSFEYVIKSDKYDMSEIQYGGGINVVPGSDADTELIKGKNGYWYNDQGEEDMKEYKDKFLIDDVHPGYKATNCGGYAKLTWDVPKGVQPHVDLSNSTNAVGFQYWWGKDSTKTSEGEDGSELNYAVIEELTLVSCTATYTRKMTVPYNTTVPGPKNKTLTLGSEDTNQVRLPIADLELAERDKLSAIEFTFESEEAMAQFVGACGISVDSAKVEAAAGVVDGWYQTGNIAVINCDDNTFKVMWILPDAIRNGVYPEGDILMGYWYGDVSGAEGSTVVDDITISDVQYHIFRTQEDDLEIKDPETGLELPTKIELTVGETYELDVNVDGATFESDRETAATVDKNGVITAVADGLANITVTTPEGQTAKIVVVVNAAETTTVVTTTKVTTTTKATTTTAVTTTVDPDTIVDWSRVLYGDVNVDTKVDLLDLVELAKYLSNAKIYPLKNATAEENADTSYDHTINSNDALALIEYTLDVLDLKDLGPDDKSDCPMYDNITVE